MNNEITVRLSIFGADNDNITSLLNIQPSKYVQKGDLITNKGTKLYEHNIWSYEAHLNDLEHIETAFEEIIKLFRYKKNELISLGKKYDLEVSISAYLKDGIPSIHFTKDNIDFIYAINAEIDIDIYTL